MVLTMPELQLSYPLRGMDLTAPKLQVSYPLRGREMNMPELHLNHPLRGRDLATPIARSDLQPERCQWLIIEFYELKEELARFLKFDIVLCHP